MLAGDETHLQMNKYPEFEFNSINSSSSAFVVKLTFKFVNWSLSPSLWLGIKKPTHGKTNNQYRWIFIKKMRKFVCKKNQRRNDFSLAFVLCFHQQNLRKSRRTNEQKRWKIQWSVLPQSSQESIFFFAFNFVLTVFNQNSTCVSNVRRFGEAFKSSKFEHRATAFEMENAYYQFNYVHQSPLINTIFHHFSIGTWHASHS